MWYEYKQNLNSFISLAYLFVVLFLTFIFQGIKFDYALIGPNLGTFRIKIKRLEISHVFILK